ncbi:hypothetical protein BO221_07630 [Archangium sp. Cb G35]|uniref:hypothetical protein n=1 Tax=Archangium sp. Cb G35 TaxID=1920190 RepID=UPI0009374E31|nr:hypothetical protein [Archangium sp. Cb G35]OJT25719.1 hypothetical protein BO221_07630 [Archangium sp. Cb G35]
MRISRFHKIVAALLSGLIASCSVTRHSAPTNVEELTRLVLVIEEAPDGRVSHSWQPAGDFDLERHRDGSSGAEGLVGRVVLASSQQSDCYARYLECYRECRQIPVPSDFSHYIEDFGTRAGHDRYCSEQCMRQYTRCLKAEERRAQEFTTTDSAVDWLKRNHRAVELGSVVVIAGIMFFAVSTGAGILVLAPAVLMTSSGSSLAPHLAAVSP